MKKISFSEIYHKRLKKYFNINNKPWEWDILYIEKANKYIWYIKWIPWLKMIGVWNSVSMNYSNEKSDIDLFIVTSENRMWLARLIITLVFQILWIRKNSKQHSWKLCLSFFATTSWLNFQDFALKDDIYLYFWIIYFKPILDFDNTYHKFIETNSSWADFWKHKNMLNNNKYIKYEEKTNYWNSKTLDCLNNLIKKIWIKKTKRNYESLWKPFGIRINDNLLKFHNNDKRKEIIKDIL